MSRWIKILVATASVTALTGFGAATASTVDAGQGVNAPTLRDGSWCC